MTISFEGRVAIVTGAGGGLGRAYALELARRGAKVVVNDLGGSRDGTGHSDAALAVVAEIEAAGGVAMSDGGSVTDLGHMQAMVGKAKSAWGGVDILINNAGILRDKSFAKMEMADFDAVVGVHLIGSANCTKAVWQFRPGQLRRRQARPCRLRQDAVARGPALQYQGQHDRADRGDADDRGHLPG
jgi:NAD(P)-dependent dehydrogenase (short-subunit alcohol dehydrogenase family)